MYKRKLKDGKSIIWHAAVLIKRYFPVCKRNDRKQIVKDCAKEAERRIKLGLYNFEAHNKNHNYADFLHHMERR